MTDLSVIQNTIEATTQDLREANALHDARLREIAQYTHDATRQLDDEWASFNDQASAECLLEIRRAMNLPDYLFKLAAWESIVRLIERNARTHADIMERNGRL